MTKKLLYKTIAIFVIFIILFSNIALATEIDTNTTNTVGRNHYLQSFAIPEKHLNLKIENLNRGCQVYLLIPEELLQYNIDKYVSNNLENVYQVQAQEARKQKEYGDSKNYYGYVEYFIECGYETKPNQIEFRHYSISPGESKLIGYHYINETRYIQFELALNDNNESKLVFKDYLEDYDIRNVKFLIDEYGAKTYIDATETPYNQNKDENNITECNFTYLYQTKESFEEVERATKLTYMIIYIILIILALIILISLVKRQIKKKEELEARKFWKKKFTKEEKKELKKKQKEEKKENKKTKKKK